MGVLLAMLSVASSAQVDPVLSMAAPVTLREATQRAIGILPETASYDASREQAAAQRAAARGPFVGPPVVSGDVLASSNGLIEQEATVSAAIRWPGEGRAGRLAADRSGFAVDAARDAARLAIAGEVRTAWWALARTRAVAAVERAQIGVAGQELVQVGRLVGAGVQSRRDLLLARAERSAASARLSIAELDLADAEAAFARLAGPTPARSPEEAMAAPGDVEAHPLVRAALGRAAAAEASADAARYASRPRLEGKVGARRERIDARGDYQTALIVGVAVPLGRDQRAVAATAGARAEALRAGADVVRVRMRVSAERVLAEQRLTVARSALVEAEDRRTALAEALGLTERGRREGEIGYIEYLRARAGLAAAERDLAVARVQASAAISIFNQAQGVLP